MKPRVERSGWICVVGLAISYVIGPGLLSTPGIVLESSGPETSVIGWFLTALIIIPFLVIFHKLKARFPDSSGMAEWVEGLWGPAAGTCLRCLQLVSSLVLLAALAYVAGDFIGTVYSVDNQTKIGLSYLLMALSVLIAHSRASALEWVHKGSFALLSLLLCVTVFYHFPYAKLELGILFNSLKSGTLPSFSQLWSVTTVVFCTFVGWESINLTHPLLCEKNGRIPQMYLGSYVFVLCLYSLIALVISGASHGGLAVTGASGVVNLIHQVPYSSFILGAIFLIVIANMGSWMLNANRLLSAIQASAKIDRKNKPDHLSLSFIMTVLVFLIHAQFIQVIWLFRVANYSFLVIYLGALLSYWKLKAVRKLPVLSITSLKLQPGIYRKPISKVILRNF